MPVATRHNPGPSPDMHMPATTTTMSSANGLICFTNCLLALQDGELVRKDLWIDERRGLILDSQHTFYSTNKRPARIIDLGGDILSPGFIDIQINGAYGFDFSIYDGDPHAYTAGLDRVSRNIVETGVTALLPTIITQESTLYPTILSLLRPRTPQNGAALLGWHAEGPFLAPAKRGAHAPPLLRTAPRGFASLEDTYGTANLAVREDWEMRSGEEARGAAVRVITAAPEVEGVMDAVRELARRDIVFSIGHSTASTATATTAVRRGARLITHLFNAMPQLHHRDPSIIGLLGASEGLGEEGEFAPDRIAGKGSAIEAGEDVARSEAFDEPGTPGTPAPVSHTEEVEDGEEKTKATALERPFYGMIVDGVHSHPNSVRLAYTAFPEGCILVTDAMKILDPNLKDGVHEWRDGQRFVKEGERLYLEGTNTLAGSVITLDKCIRNFTRFTGCSLGHAIKCATYNPARCLGIEAVKGTLRPGADADLVVLSGSGRVKATWVGGREVWARK